MAPPATESLTLPVLGMTCASCQHHVEDALRSTAGVESAHVDLMAHRASVVFDPALAAPGATGRGHSRSRLRRRASPRRTIRPPVHETRDDRKRTERKAWVTLAAGAAAMLLAMPLGTEMGALDHALMRLFPWLYALPPDPLRWFLLVLTACRRGLGRARHLPERDARPAPRHHQHEHAGEPGNRRGLCLLRLCHGLARAGRQVYFDAVLLILGFLLLGKSAGSPRQAPRPGRARLALPAAPCHRAPHSRWRSRRSFRSKRFSPATACWFCPASAFRWMRPSWKAAPGGRIDAHRRTHAAAA